MVILVDTYHVTCPPHPPQMVAPTKLTHLLKPNQTLDRQEMASAEKVQHIKRYKTEQWGSLH